MSISSIADAANATARLYDFFDGELLEDSPESAPELDVAVSVKNASFTWDAPPPEPENGKGKKKGGKTGMKRLAKAPEVPKDYIPFVLRDISLEVPRGQLVAIVGPVGCGKTSLLQGLIGEMRQLVKQDGSKGVIAFGGNVGYCSQSAWIQVIFKKIPFKTSHILQECNHSREHMFR